MVQFGATLEEQRHEDWAQYYLNYNGLKKQLKKLKQAYNQASDAAQHHGGNSTTNSNAASPQTPSAAGRHSGHLMHKSLRRRFTSSYSLVVGDDIGDLEDHFSSLLDAEVEKVVLFFLAKQGELARRLLSARRRTESRGCEEKEAFLYKDYASDGSRGDRSSSGYALLRYASSPGSGRHSAYCSIGREIAELMRFLQLNVSGLRKILKKHDKQVRDKMIATNYLSTRAQQKYSSMRQLYNNEGIMALVASLRNAFQDSEMERYGAPHAYRWSTSHAPGGDEEAGEMRFNQKAALRMARVSGRSFSEASATDGVLAEIAAAQQNLAEAQHLTISKYLSLQVLLDGSGWNAFDDEFADTVTERELHRVSAFINLGTTFLYMTNYYIVGPTSAEYAAALGGSPAVSGLIIGMTPIAACFSCLLYSWWTNTSFRQPLMLCSGMLVVGNLLYGVALFFDAFWMVLLGRTLIGLGGARGVNRRYIADTIPIESRTAFSAAFVAAGALGMAFGPFLAALMNTVDFDIAGLTFNGLTNPGWIMFALWFIMGVVIYLDFQEPPHGHVSASASDEDTPVSTPSLTDRKSAKKSAVTGAGDYGSTSSAKLSSIAIEGDTDDTRNGSDDTQGSSSATNTPGATVPTVAAISAGDRGVGADEAAALLSSSATGENLGASSPSDGNKLRTDADDDEDDSSREEGGAGGMCAGSIGAISPPLAFCLFGYFVNKLVTEAFTSCAQMHTYRYVPEPVVEKPKQAAVSSAPVLTQYMFEWSVREVGVLMAILGLVVLPINAMVGRLSLVYEDRVLLQVLAVLACLGCLLMVNFPWIPFDFTEAQYIAGLSLTFVALQAHEGIIMSVTSKIIPPKLARGTWNSGFLATEAGTFGRFVGDALITMMGVMTLVWLDFLLFFPSAILVILMVLGFWVVYPFLQGES